MIRKPRLLSSRVVHDGWLKVRLDEIKLDGLPPYTYDVVTIGDGVAVLPFLTVENLLLAVQYRHPVEDTLLELIQGGIAKGETPHQAAHRELREETGYDGTLEYLRTMYPLPGSLDMRLHLFSATSLAKKGDQELDTGETLELTAYPYHQLLLEVLAGKHKDSALVTAMMHYALLHKY